jgi:hypothetical protein
MHTNTPRCLCFARALEPFQYEMTECLDCKGATLSQPALGLLTKMLEAANNECPECR